MLLNLPLMLKRFNHLVYYLKYVICNKNMYIKYVFREQASKISKKDETDKNKSTENV